MRPALLLIPIPVVACQAPASLPPAQFILKCAAPKGQGIPIAAKSGFVVVVNQSTKKFSAPWWLKGEQPLGSVTPDLVIFIDRHIVRGRDYNPEDYRITFDLKTGTFDFYEAYAGRIPVRNQFKAKCEVNPISH
jgi:hypothetical protein